MKKKLPTIILSLAMFLLFLTGCSGDGPSGTISGGDWTPGQTSVKLLGGSWYSENGHVYVFYSAEATNKSSKTFDGSTINVNCLDEEGHGLYSSPSYIVAIAAGGTIRYSNSFDYIGRIPTSLDLRFTDNPAMYSDDKVSQRSDFVVSDIHSSSSNAFYTISGTVINNSFKKQSVQVSAIFKQDGKIVGGKISYSDPIEVGKSGSFTIYLPHTFENCDLYEVVATAY